MFIRYYSFHKKKSWIINKFRVQRQFDAVGSDQLDIYLLYLNNEESLKDIFLN